MLDTFAGNKEIKETIEACVSSGRFPHAFIIEGEKGSGRHTLARIITAAALCEDEKAPCGRCRICDLVMRDGHSDVLTYRPDGATFKIDSVREIRDNAFVMPIEAKRKVNILIDCDKMNEPAQNAFLKVLEEPPEFMVFILICQNAQGLLTTVRSRCVTLSVKNPDRTEAADYIALKTGRNEADINEALENSHGNIGKAMDILSGEAAEAVLAAAEFLRALKKRDRFEALKCMYRFEKDRLGFTAFLTELRLLAQREAQKCATKKGSVSPSTVAKLLELIERTELEYRRHIGQPLSVPLTAAAICAELFS
ncbi:MAG: hypothetical protein J6S13_00660 [Clostridia bacterium]|nr:hypothetical protein [Clostridia bacterium]